MADEADEADEANGGSADQPGTPGPQDIQLIVPPGLLVGTYANFAQVVQSEYEFTIDFARIDFAQSLAVLVARLSISPVLAEQLARVLEGELAKYADKALQEVLPNVPNDEGQGGSDGGRTA